MRRNYVKDMQGIRYFYDVKQIKNVCIDDVNYMQESPNWMNQFHEIIDGRMHLSQYKGAYIHRVAAYNPPLYYEPVYNKKHYEMILEFSADFREDERAWMALFIGVRNSSIVPGEANPNNLTDDFFASFREKPLAHIFHGIKKDWPVGSCKVSLREGLKSKRKLSVLDNGSSFVFSSLDDDVRKNLFVVDISTETLRVLDDKENVIYEADNNLKDKKGGWFKIFNHFARTVLYSIKIIEHDIEMGTERVVFEDTFRYFDTSANYKIVQFQTSGDVRFYINRTVLTVSKGQILLISPYDIHADLSLYNIRHLVEFERDYVSRYFSDEAAKYLLAAFQSNLVFIPEHEHVRLQNLFADLRSCSKSVLFLRIGEILCLINDTGVSVQNSIIHHNEVSHVVEYIDSNFDSIDSLDTIAKHFYVSTSHLCRMFKRAMNKTIVEYLNEVRIAHACRLLAETDESITDIFLKCGFNYSSYFAKVFKSITGQTPTGYRKSVRKKN